MNLRAALRVTVILAWVGLVVELARINPWVIPITALTWWLGRFTRTRR